MFTLCACFAKAYVFSPYSTSFNAHIYDYLFPPHFSLKRVTSEMYYFLLNVKCFNSVLYCEYYFLFKDFCALPFDVNIFQFYFTTVPRISLVLTSVLIFASLSVTQWQPFEIITVLPGYFLLVFISPENCCCGEFISCLMTADPPIIVSCRYP